MRFLAAGIVKRDPCCMLCNIFITSEGLVNARVGDIFSYLSKANFFVVVNALKMFHFDGYDELLKSAGF